MIPGFFAASSGAEWSPISLSPRLWLDDSTGVTDVSGAASEWKDKSGGDLHVSQSTAASRPVILPSAVNGRRALQFDGFNDLMINDSPQGKSIFRNVSSAWAFVVFKRSATGGATCVLFGSSNASDPGRARLRMDIAGNKIRLSQLRTDGTTPLTVSGATDVDTNWHAALITMDWSSAEGRIYLDGALDGSASSFGSTGSSANSESAGSLTVGANMNESEAFCNGAVACVIAGANSIPTSVQRDRLFAWVQDRYGL